MNLIEGIYNIIAKSYNTDLDGAKEIVAKFLKDLKKEIDESGDEKLKTLWYEDFGDTPDPDPDWYVLSTFLVGHNPYTSKKQNNLQSSPKDFLS